MLRKQRSDTKVNAVRALEFRLMGWKLVEIRDYLAPDASLMAVSRAIRRARQKEKNVETCSVFG
jgi:hypothetical protein